MTATFPDLEQRQLNNVLVVKNAWSAVGEFKVAEWNYPPCREVIAVILQLRLLSVSIEKRAIPLAKVTF